MAEKNKRSKSKYPALDKRYNLLGRQEFIETEYINGVKDEDGNTIIRALTDEEKAWLNQFYTETVNANFSNTTDLKALSRLKKSIINDESVQVLKEEKKLVESKLNAATGSEALGLKKEHTKLVNDIRKLKRLNKDFYREELTAIEDEIQSLRDSTLLHPNKEQHKVFYNQNYLRNEDVYNRAKKTGMLRDFNPAYYDVYCSESIAGHDYELEIISYLEPDEDDELS